MSTNKLANIQSNLPFQKERTKKIYSLFIRDEPPQVHLKEMRIHLNLLQSKLAERPQPYAFQQSLQIEIY